ncbi:MAG: protein kinase [Fimbriimonadaceae bacterium]|jgi:serine/threonine-protein kinase|nr:protein kinase [Fimbriimonadaceae bacterium]
MSASPPNTLGKYQIIREIARSNDIVYEAYDPVMHRRVAVKELAVPGGATQAQREDRLKRFLREARAAGSLVHPNIVTVYEVGDQGDRNYIAMEFLDGGTLRQEMEREGFLSPLRSVEVGIEVLAGLAFAHRNGVVHRDIKPENIQILENNQIKLTDFGIARLTFEPNLTMDGQVFGTPSYMSPEQINGKEIDARSDIFSVGVILYEMVSGQKPFPGDSVVTITYAIMNKEPSQPGQCPYPLWQVIQKALNKSPTLRFNDADQMIRELELLKVGMQSGDPLMATGGFASSQIAGMSPPMAQGSVIPAGPVNPYSPPVQAPPPMGSPYLPTTTGYAPPSASPYGSGFVATQQPYGQTQPGIYQQPYQPTQPYQPGQVYSTPYGAQNPLVPGQTAPIYIPPPRRRVSVSPETKLFFWRLVVAILGLGLVIGAILWVINVLGTTPIPSSQTPATPESEAPVRLPQGGIGDQSSRSRSDSPSSPPESPREIVPDQLSDQQVARRSASATMLVITGMTEPAPSRRRDSWDQATQTYAELMTERPDLAPRIEQEAFESFLAAADALASQSRLAEREALLRAEAFTGQDPSKINLIRSRLGEIIQ